MLKSNLSLESLTFSCSVAFGWPVLETDHAYTATRGAIYCPLCNIAWQLLLLWLFLQDTFYSQKSIFQFFACQISAASYNRDL